jgi:threonine dehydratase
VIVVDDVPTLDDIRAASERIVPFVHRTPVLRCSSIDELVGARVHLKAEHLQRAGAFKFRGATNAVQRLDDATAARGVAAHSSGNHASALALAASIRGIPCHVVMPTDTPATKQRAAAAFGASIVLCEPTLEARAVALAEVVARTGATEVHPYDNREVIAGQGTATLELLEDVPQLGAVLAPVSGGGLLSGTAIAAHGIRPDLVVLGGEPAAVDDAPRSLLAGRRTSSGNGTSIAVGLLAVLSDRTFQILADHRVEVITVTEDEIVTAMALLFGRAKQVVEPSGAVGVAALIARGRRGPALPDDVGVILSGGNVDLDRLPFTTPTPTPTHQEPRRDDR